MKLRILILTSLLLNSLIFAQESPISTDRPGFSAGTYTVQPGMYNFEFGYQYTFNNEGIDVKTHTLPLLVVRTGLSPKIEINIFWAGWNITKFAGVSNTSNTDLVLASKFRLSETEKYNLTGVVNVSLPVGTAPSTSDNVDPMVGLIWDYALANNVTAFGVLYLQSFKVVDREFAFQPAIGLTTPLSDKVGVFIEWYGNYPFDNAFGNTTSLDGGFTYLVNNDVQLDINGGFGLQNGADKFIGVGVAIRR
jgi:hypothetical protein